MESGKDQIFLPSTHTLSSNTVGLLLHLLQFYQRCEPMILKLWAKSKFILSQPRYYNLLTDKKDKKIHVFEILIYWKRTVAVNPKKLSSSTIFRWYTFAKFYIVKYNHFSGGPNKTKDIFWNIFLKIDYCSGDIGNKNIPGNY